MNGRFVETRRLMRRHIVVFSATVWSLIMNSSAPRGWF